MSQDDLIYRVHAIQRMFERGISDLDVRDVLENGEIVEAYPGEGEENMQCPICKHGQTAPATVTVTLERHSATVIFRNVPAQVCDTCGEQYVDESTTSRLLSQADEAARAGVQVEVRSYAAA